MVVTKMDRIRNETIGGTTKVEEMSKKVQRALDSTHACNESGILRG